MSDYKKHLDVLHCVRIMLWDGVDSDDWDETYEEYICFAIRSAICKYHSKYSDSCMIGYIDVKDELVDLVKGHLGKYDDYAVYLRSSGKVPLSATPVRIQKERLKLVDKLILHYEALEY